MVSFCHRPGGEWWADFLRGQVRTFALHDQQDEGYRPRDQRGGPPMFRVVPAFVTCMAGLLICGCATDVLPEPEARRVTLARTRTCGCQAAPRNDDWRVALSVNFPVT